MLDVIGAVVVFVAVNAAMLPVPLAAKPVAVFVFVQLYTAPATGPPMVTAAVVDPAHTTWFEIAFTVGVGLTVIVKLTGVPVQVVALLVNVGVTVIVPDIGAVPLFVATNGAILPVPLAGRPMAGLLFVQLYTVPGTLPVKLTGELEEALQRVWLLTAFTVGFGLTVIVNVVGVPVQVAPPLVYAGVTVIVDVTGTVPVLMALNEAIFPVPLAGRPIVELLLVQL
jgi:hypothetical protein